MNEIKTAGEKSVKASQDKTIYDPLEVAHAYLDDIEENLRICAERHSKIFDEDEFCLVMVVAGDPLIHNLRRHKFYGWLYLPDPRPQQSVFLFNKKTHQCKRLWSLPNPKIMAVISTMKTVHPNFLMTKYWCDAFYNQNFHQKIRDQHKIDMLSESEYLNLHRSKFIKSGVNEVNADFSQPFDFSKIAVEQVINEVKPTFVQ